MWGLKGFKLQGFKSIWGQDSDLVLLIKAEVVWFKAVGFGLKLPRAELTRLAHLGSQCSYSLEPFPAQGYPKP